MDRIEQELRQLEEVMKEIIEKAPAIMEQMKRIADIAKGIRFVDEGEEEADKDDFTVMFPGLHGESETRDRVYDVLETHGYHVKGYGEGERGRYINFGNDKPSPPEAERWEVVCSKGHYRIESTYGKRIALSDCIPLETAIAMAGALETRDALRMVTVKSNFERITTGGRYADEISVKFNPDEWRIITDALEKAGG